jgi:rRNA maturation endonuclease Nob1
MKQDKTFAEFAEQIQTFMGQTVQAFSIVDNQLSKLNIVLFALLKDMGKTEDITCANCGERVTRPIINGLPKQDECPTCGENLFDNKQTTVEDWDSGLIVNDESE